MRHAFPRHAMAELHRLVSAARQAQSLGVWPAVETEWMSDALAKCLSAGAGGLTMKTTVWKAKGGVRSKTLKEEKRDIGKSIKAFGNKVAKKLKKV
jgi:hypothetical protein